MVTFGHQSIGKNDNSVIVNISFGNVAKLKYLRMTMTNRN